MRCFWKPPHLICLGALSSCLQLEIIMKRWPDQSISAWTCKGSYYLKMSIIDIALVFVCIVFKFVVFSKWFLFLKQRWTKKIKRCFFFFKNQGKKKLKSILAIWNSKIGHILHSISRVYECCHVLCFDLWHTIFPLNTWQKGNFFC